MNEQAGSAKSVSEALKKLYKLEELLDDAQCADDLKILGEALIALDEADLPDIFQHIAYRLYVAKMQDEGLSNFTGSVKIAWSLTHYDGPCSGIAQLSWDTTNETLSKTYYYFNAACDIHSRYPRVYKLFPLSDEDVKLEMELQKLRRKCIGSYNEYDTCGKRKTSAAVSDPDTKQYYEKERELQLATKREEYKKRRPAGYFIR